MTVNILKKALFPGKYIQGPNYHRGESTTSGENSLP